MMELKVMGYEECREEYFRKLLDIAQRKLHYWERRVKKNSPYNSRSHIKCSELGAEVCYLRDALKRFGCEVEDGNEE